MKKNTQIKKEQKLKTKAEKGLAPGKSKYAEKKKFQHQGKISPNSPFYEDDSTFID